MPKDNRRIHSGVRHEGTTYKAGMEDDLAAAVGQAGLERLASKGAISGDWSSSAGAKPVVEETAETVDAGEEEIEEAETVAEKPAKKGARKPATKK